MRTNLVAFIAGLVFAVGLCVSGMTNPAKVLGFLDFTGAWDPSLAFVMAGAILIYALGYHFIVGKKPETNTKIDRPLLLGSAIFGIGWGLSGYCPGPALVSLAGFQFKPFIFVLVMLAGMALHTMLKNK